MNLIFFINKGIDLTRTINGPKYQPENPDTQRFLNNHQNKILINPEFEPSKDSRDLDRAVESSGDNGTNGPFIMTMKKLEGKLGNCKGAYFGLTSCFIGGLRLACRKRYGWTAAYGRYLR